MEIAGDKIVFTAKGLKMWEGMEDTRRWAFLNCVNMVFNGFSRVEVVNVSGEQKLEEMMKRLGQNEALQKQLEELRYYIRANDVSTQLSEMRLYMEKVMNRSVQEKGREGERSVMEALESTLLNCDGYSVEDVSKLPNNCDILVKRVGHGDVRIDVKNWSRNVSSKDVEKFENDLTHLDTSGIMLSLNTGVVGKRNFEINQLMTGKFAMYLCDFGSSLDDLPEYIRLLHTLERVCKSDDECIRVDKMAVSRIQMYLQENSNRVSKLKQTLRTAVTLANEIDYQQIGDIVRGVELREVMSTSTPVPQVVQQFECPTCKQMFRSKAGMVSHAKRCNGTPVVLQPTNGIVDI